MSAEQKGTGAVEIRQLRSFLGVVEHGSVSAAAAHLFITQPGLTRQIRELERHLGQTLFTRSWHGMTLTEAGLRLLPHASVVVEQADLAVRALRAGAAVGEAPLLRLGINADTATRVLPRLARLQRSTATSGLRMTVVTRPDEVSLHEMLDNGELEAMVTWWVDPARQHTSQRLFEEPLVAVLPRADERSELAVLDPQDVSAAPGPVVMYPPELGRSTHDALVDVISGPARRADFLLTAPPVGPAASVQNDLVSEALRSGAATVVTAHNWASRLRHDQLIARPLTGAAAQINIVWNASSEEAAREVAHVLGDVAAVPA